MYSFTSNARSSAALPLALILLATTACAHNGEPSDTDARPAPPAPDMTVTAEDMDRTHEKTVEEYLQGRVSGVVVKQTPGGIAVRIRGGSSINGNNDPLYVIDGMAVQSGPNGALTGINPFDIESIKVLKNAAETAMYGVRGANGVVVITTKRPGN